jgi:hypothetical protein
MYSPIIIDDSDQGKPVYEQSIHNQQLCVQCRFPFVEDMFIYEEGKIAGIRGDYKHSTTGQDASFLAWFVTKLASTSEKSNVARITNPEEFINSINTARWVD